MSCCCEQLRFMSESWWIVSWWVCNGDTKCHTRKWALLWLLRSQRAKAQRRFSADTESRFCLKLLLLLAPQRHRSSRTLSPRLSIEDTWTRRSFIPTPSFAAQLSPSKLICMLCPERSPPTPLGGAACPHCAIHLRACSSLVSSLQQQRGDIFVVSMIQILIANIRLSSVTYDFPHPARMSEKQLFCHLSSFHVLLGRGWIRGREGTRKGGGCFHSRWAFFQPVSELCITVWTFFPLSDRNEWKGS